MKGTAENEIIIYYASVQSHFLSECDFIMGCEVFLKGQRMVLCMIQHRIIGEYKAKQSSFISYRFTQNPNSVPSHLAGLVSPKDRIS